MPLTDMLRAEAARRAGERHRGRRQLWARPRGPDPALGRRGRPADAGFHRRCRHARARRRRNLLHLAARHSRVARGAGALSTSGISAWRSRRTNSSSRSAACRRSSWRCRRRRAPATRRSIWRRPGRISPAPPALPARFRSPVPLDRRRQWLVLRCRPRRGGGHAAHQVIFVNTPSNPTGWTADHRDAAGAPRSGAPPWPLDHRRRDLFAVPLWRTPRAVLHGHHGAGGPHPLRQHLLQELGDDRLAHRLAALASLAGAHLREPDPVFDLRRRAVHAARRRRRARRGRRVPRIAGEAAQAARDLVCRMLGETGRVRFSVPPGAFYLFFSVDGMKDSTQGRLRHRRQGQCRPGARHRLRRGGRGLSPALLPPPPRPGRGSRQPAGGVDQKGLSSFSRRTSAPAAG